MSCRRGTEVMMAMEEEEEEEKRKVRNIGVEEEEEEEEESGVVRWERFLPRVSLRVLVVEGDDSTRQIIAALLRKCSYRIVVVSDSIKAWETLMEKPHSIDLVLTEVDLPSVSGLGLLTMIIDHEICKNIPVIMMSSHDSISTVYKCMLKGASDFLVKPIRKNELRNLWQHVWRRHSLSGGHSGTHARQEENLAKRKLEAMSEKGNHLYEDVSSMQNNKECSEKGSDAHSSCTRSDTEAESTYMLELKQPICRDFFLLNDTIAQNGEGQIQLDKALLMHKGEAEDKSIMLGSEATPINGANEQILEDDCSCALVEPMNEDTKPTESVDDLTTTNEMNRQNCDQDKPSKEAIDLIGVIDNQPRCSNELRNSSALQNSPSNTPETLFHNKDFECKSSSMPLLELSLRRYQHSRCDKQEYDEWNTLKHSGSSAFSLYNSRPAMPTLFTPMNFQTQHEECFSTTSAPQLNGLVVSNMNIEVTKSQGVEIPSQDGMAVKCSPLRVVPFHIPTRGISAYGLSSGYGSVMQPIFYPQSAAYPLQSTTPTMWQEAIHTNSSHQSEPQYVNSLQSHHPDDQSPKSPLILHPAQKQQVNMKVGDEHRHVSSVTGDSGSSSICNGRASQLNNSGCGSICHGSNGNITAPNISKATAEMGNEEGIFANEGKKPIDFHCLNQREAALNKFRLKRKERCYEKKVRYQSRKRLAEQRPQVKGQFVRQVQPDPPSMEASCDLGSDSQTG